MLKIDLVGWDLGGAHVKAALFAEGELLSVAQRACPLWLGLERFHDAISALVQEWAIGSDCRHAVTMTGELADIFDNRETGVFGLLNALSQHAKPENIRVFAGQSGFLAVGQVTPSAVPSIASANWLASGLFAATRLRQGLLVDIGSTTTDLLPVSAGTVQTRGLTDHERLRHGELVYSGVVRTSLMSIARQAPFRGEWVGLMAEHFATTADVYRLTGELPAHADQGGTADGCDKSLEASARRISRLLGSDLEGGCESAWRRLAGYFREQQLNQLAEACMRQCSRGLLDAEAPLIGAGIGSFLVQELARRLGFAFLNFADLLPMPKQASLFNAADCAPAVAVACLADPPHA